MPYVTVNGASGGSVVVTFQSSAYADYATALLGDQLGTLVSVPGGAVVSGGGVTGIGPASLSDPSLGAVALVDTSTDAGQLILTGVGTDLSFSAASGSGTIISGGGKDTFGVGSGDWFILTSTDSSVVSLGSGNDTIGLHAADTLFGGSGSSTVFDNSPGSTIVQGSGSMLYVAGGGDSTIYAGSGTLTSFGGTGTTTILLGNGVSEIIGEDGTTSIVGGSVATEFFGNAGSVMDYAGATDNNLFVAGSGNETLNGIGASGANVFYAGSGNDVMVGGSGNDILFGGSGDATMTGGAGGNLFAFANEVGSTSADVITDFTSQDSIALYGGLTYTESTGTDGDLVLSLSDGATISFTNVTSIDPSKIHG